MGSGKSKLQERALTASTPKTEPEKATPSTAAQLATPRGNPLPSVVHATLSREQIGSGRIIVIGDIHGCSLELQDLLDEAEYRPDDVIVSVGDLVGKGPHSRKVLKRAIELGIVTVRGNWEENALAAYRASGGRPEDAKWSWLQKAHQAEIDYMQGTPFSLSIPSHGCIVVHAGMLPGVELEKQDLFDLIEMRHVDLVNPPEPGSNDMANPQQWKALPKFPREAGKPWATAWPGPQHIIFGHHARRRLQTCGFASGIDTGCCLGDQLTALVLPTLKELDERNWRPPPSGVTREDLGAKLVSVQARQQYRADDKD